MSSILKKTVNSTDSAPPVGPYSPAIISNNMMFISGQIPILADGSIITGDFEKETRQVLLNITALLTAANLTWEHVIKVNIFTTDLSQFSTINRIYDTFVVEPYPARAAVEVSALPKGARIEMEAIAVVK